MAIEYVVLKIWENGLSGRPL